MKSRLVCVFVLFFSTIVFAQLSELQLHKIDSLKNLIDNAKHDTSKINALEAWDNIIYVSNPSLDKKLNEDIIKLSEINLRKENLSDGEQKKFKKSLALAQNSLGIVFYNKGEYSKALDYYSKSLKLRKEIGDKKGLAATLNNMAIIYQDQAEYSKAIEHYTHSLSINEEIGDKMGEANCLGNIGRVFLEQNEPMKAIGYQTRSLKIRKTIDDKRGIAIAYNNLAVINSNMGIHYKAIEFLEQSLKLSEEIGDEKKIATANANIGLEYSKLGKDNIALHFLNKGLKKYEEIGDQKSIATFLNTIGSIYKKKGDYKRALEYAQKALYIAKSGNQVAVTRDVSISLGELYEITGNCNGALEMQKLFTKLKDSILNENNQKEVLRQELKYTYEKQKAIDAKEHEKQLAIAEEQEQKQKVITFAIVLILLLVIVFSAFALQRLQVTRKQKNIIELQKKIVEEKQNEIVESINYSKRIQNALLPSLDHMKEFVPDLFVFNEPKDIVSGDFYYFKRFENCCVIACVDCTGHGVSGGFMSTLGSLLIDKIVNDKTLKPSDILFKLNEEIVRTLHQQAGGEIQDGMDLSICLIDKNSGTIKYSGARNGIIVVKNNEAIRYKANLLPVGGNYRKKGVPIERNFKTESIVLNDNDWVYMYTDGFVEQIGGNENQPMNYKQFEEKLVNVTKLNNDKDKNEYLKLQLLQWANNNKQTDDILIIGFKI